MMLTQGYAIAAGLPAAKVRESAPAAHAAMHTCEAGHAGRTGTSSVLASWGTGSVGAYDSLVAVGEGAFGQVYRARCRSTGQLVALKKVRMEVDKEGFPISAVREICMLRQLRHKNVVALRNVVMEDEVAAELSAVYLVFEYMEHDLLGLLQGGLLSLRTSDAAILMRHLLEGLAHCHAMGIVHRDIKSSNLLVSDAGELKIGDFGLSRHHQHGDQYTNKVITLWYRPPELLLGQERYGSEVDMWSAGCILGELFNGRAIFRGQDELNQYTLISRVCGTLTPAVWSGVLTLPLFRMFTPVETHPRCLAKSFKRMPPDAVDLLDRLLCLDPSRRPSAAATLSHGFVAWCEGRRISVNLEQECHEMWARERLQKMHAQRKAQKDKA